MVPGEGLKVCGFSALMRHSMAWPLKRMSSWRSDSGAPARDPDLLDDEIEPGDHLGDGVLDLEAGVHLDEVELAVLIEELDRADAAIAQLAHGLGHGLADADALALR